MFRALLRSKLPKDEVFAVTVGASSKKTLASWHLLEPRDVIAAITSLIAADEDDQTLDRTFRGISLKAGRCLNESLTLTDLSTMAPKEATPPKGTDKEEKDEK